MGLRWWLGYRRNIEDRRTEIPLSHIEGHRGINRVTMINKYPLTDAMRERLDNDYQYHAPMGDQQERYILLRNEGKHLAIAIVQNTPVSREQSVALTLLDQLLMMANAAIARNEKE